MDSDKGYPRFYNLESLNSSFSIDFKFQLLIRIIEKICKEWQNGQLRKLIPTNQIISNSIKYADIGDLFEPKHLRN